MATNPVTNFRTTLAGGLASGGSETTIDLSSVTTTDSHALTMSDIGDIGFVVINPGGSTMEICSFTGITSTQLTGVVRGLPFYGTSTSAVTANKKAHGSGETVIISNNHHWFQRYGALSDDETITGAWSGPTPTNSDHLATKGYVDGVAIGSLTHDANIVAGNAGETVAAGNLVYFDDTDNEWKLCDADTAASVQNVMLGIAQGSGTNGNAITGGVLIFGLDENQSGLTAGALYYASNTAGGLSASTGTTERVIGFARNTTTLYFDPYFYYAVTASQKAAMAGGGDLGTPSGSNKFQTEEGVTAALADAGKFGGTGADGALSITSGTTTLDAGNANVFIKNYTSISITGTGELDFSNPATDGTIVILKATGDVTITSSATAAIDLRGMGAAGSVRTAGQSSQEGTSPYGLLFTTSTPQGGAASTVTGGAAGGAFTSSIFYSTSADRVRYRRSIMLTPGAGGASGDGSSGSPTPGAGGRGGGALIIECAGSLNFTGTINSSGSDGTASSGVGGSNASAGAGGGGAAGMVIIMYNSQTAVSGTITASGGAGGTSQAGTGTTDNGGGGGGGAGSVVAAGGAGGSVGNAGSAAAGLGAGGGGGGGRDGAGAGFAGGAGGGSMGGVLIENTIFM